MSSGLLAKLKVKPVPKKKETVEIIIPTATKKEEVVIKTKIVDKRDDADIDRNAILERIKSRLAVQKSETKSLSQREVDVGYEEEKEGVTLSKLLDLEREEKEKQSQLDTEAKVEVEVENKEPTEIAEPKVTFKIKTKRAKDSDLESKSTKQTRKLKTRFTIKEAKEEEEETQAKEETKIPQGTEEKEDLLKTLLLKKTQERGEEPVEPSEKITIKLKRTGVKKPKGEVIERGPLTILEIGDTSFSERIPKEKQKILIRASSYYMSNRQIFVNFITSLFEPYREQFENDKLTFSCDEKDGNQFDLLTHQKLIRDYINIYTPYRGLLLYHGLGSGKTCSSIAIAEGIKTQKQIIVMTPASLRMNYIESLKKCGDDIYKKNQFWEFITLDSTTNTTELTRQLSFLLSLPDTYITKNNGAWFMNVKKSSNYEQLNTQEKKQLDDQLTEMIRYKYSFINYNGIRNDTLASMTENFSINPFDNKVVIIDEAHNFVSRIVNKINKKDLFLSTRLYNYIMEAKNAKIILLTGTPMINYPNELGILFNMLRGKIKTWSIKLVVESDKKVSQETLYRLFKSKNRTKKLLDYIEYKSSSTTLIITRNPFGFYNTYDREEYNGVQYSNEAGDISDDDFLRNITNVLKDENINIAPNGVQIEEYKTLPDNIDQFKQYFINTDGSLKNMELFKRRILGLVSYFSDIDKLMPKYNKHRDFNLVKIPMSDYQFSIYENARSKERQEELKNATKYKKKKSDIYDESISSTYRIFSRLFCNFVFPETIERPLPNVGRNAQDGLNEAIEKGINEDDIEAYSPSERIINDVDGKYEADDEQRIDVRGKIDVTYGPRIQEALDRLWVNRETALSDEALQTYSPKFLSILEKINDPEKRGLHLIYSQFRTMEGIGIFKLVLEHNGYTQFKIRKNEAGIWNIDIKEEDRAKPMFALYTGTETSEEKEIIRNIFNNNIKFVPSNLARYIQSISNNNLYGAIIKVLIISASGAEGIDLKNVRFVHLMESYWHPVRIEQVIGRARRICSHKDLPIELQTVEVFLYLMTFTVEQLTGDLAIELKLKDRSKIDTSKVITSDESLYEISVIKENISSNLLLSLKEASIDCTINTSGKEQLRCFSFGSPNKDSYAITPSINNESFDTEAMLNKQEVTWKAQEIFIQGKQYVINKLTNEIYDYNSYKLKNPILLGRIEKVTDKLGKVKLIVKWI
jgi:hypothetical protein